MLSIKHTPAYGHLAAGITILIWGTTLVSTKTLLVAFQPVEILFFRFLLGYFALLAPVSYTHLPRILGTSAMFCPAHASALQAMAISPFPATAGKLPNRARAKKTMLRFSMPQKSLRQLHSIVSAPLKRSPQSARRFAGKSSAKL